MTYPTPRTQIKLGLGALLIILAIVVVGHLLLGWLVVTIISWFGPQLAVWKGVVIVVALSLLTGGSSAAK